MNVIRPLVGFALLLMVGIAAAQSPRTEHTYRIDDPDNPPQATLADAAMLVGSWTGTAFGGTFEAVWNPPSAGSMIGLFKFMREGQVSFYEILLLNEEQGTLSLKVKHFGEDFGAWEDKNEFIDFRFVKAEDDAIHFQGISFYRISEDEMHGYLVMRNGEEIREEKLVYRRAARGGAP